MNDRIYIHELIDIDRHNRARYMHHMTANWCPTARAVERNMLCYGVWGTVGSTGRWPEVVNIWELPGWDGLVANLEHELSTPSLQDPSLAEWWAVAAEMRRGGFDRILVPEPWSPTIEELTAEGTSTVLHAHEIVTIRSGTARPFLDALSDTGLADYERWDLRCVGAFRVAMTNAAEAVVVWAIPSLQLWSRFEQAWEGTEFHAWRARLDATNAVVRRILMVAAPLSPMRTLKQPQIEDRLPLERL